MAALMMPGDIEDIAEEIALEVYGQSLPTIRFQAMERHDPERLFAIYRDAQVIRYIRMGRGPEVQKWFEKIPNFEKLQELAARTPEWRLHE